MADGIGLDLGDLAFRIAKGAQRFRNGAVDDLEIAATGELLELDERKVGLDAGGVAVHDETDRAGRRDDRDLGIAVAMLFAELQRLVPSRCGMGDQGRIGAVGMHERNRVDREAFIAIRQAECCAAMVADDAQHVVAVRRKAREGAEFRSDFG